MDRNDGSILGAQYPGPLMFFAHDFGFRPGVFYNPQKYTQH